MSTAKSSSLATSKVDFGTKRNNPRKGAIRKVTIHHMAGNMGAVNCANFHKNGNRDASANYYIGSDGAICAGVPENRRAWTSSNGNNDHAAITFEVANNSAAPNWTVSNKAYESTIKLASDICSRYGINPHFDGTASASLTTHDMFASTNCPGPYLKGKLRSGQIAKDIKNGKASVGNDPAPQTPTPMKPVAAGTKATVTCDLLNVRSGPGTGHSKIGSLTKGKVVDVKAEGGGWLNITYNGKSAYIFKQYTKLGGSAPKAPTTPSPSPGAGQSYTVKSGDTLGSIASRFKVAGGYQALAKFNGISNPNLISVGQVIKIPGGASTPAPATRTATVTCDVLNVRTGPGTNHSKIGTLRKGAKVSVKGESNGWLNISYNGKNAFVSKQYTSISSGSAPEPSAAPKK
ncbi:MAG: SH3 domain-containing protein, partial [Bradymonadales bacterium]